jgi:hypothetical protein
MRFCGLLLAGFLLFSAVAGRAQAPAGDENSVLSLSGQFRVSRADTPVEFGRGFALSDTNLLQLKPAVVAVAAERFKSALWRELGFPPNAGWSGKVFFNLHAARTANETVAIAAGPFLNRWDYRVDLPDRLTRSRCARALTGVLLLEIANRQTTRDGHSAEVPSWLVDGMAQQVLATEGDNILFSAPVKRDEPLAIGRLNNTRRGWDPLASARLVLQNGSPLTFDQLSWPTDGQMNREDGGVYYASAQLFQAELLALKNGPERMRAMLAELPANFNWQTAFYHAFAADFQRPLDVEKWWALRTVIFAERAPGPRWTTDVSIVRLQELLGVPVEFRGESNSLPGHTEISLQTALESLGPEQRDRVVRLKMRDLALEELRFAPPFGALADGYRVTLAGFLGELKRNDLPTATKHGVPPDLRTAVNETVRQLDALDERRRAAENRAFVPGAVRSGVDSPAPPASGSQRF